MSNCKQKKRIFSNKDLVLKQLITLILFGLPLCSPAIDKIILQEHLPNNPIIIEAGGYDGGDTQEMAALWPAARIYSFEPLPDLFTILQEKTRNYPNVTCIPLALSIKTGTAQFFVSSVPGALSGSSSLLEPNEHLDYYPSVHFENKIEVKTINLDEWCCQNNLDHIDFMWLDMQGAEIAMLKAAPKMVKTVSAIYIEISFAELYKGSCLFDETCQWFESHGFELKYLEIASSQIEGNALFARKR